MELVATIPAPNRLVNVGEILPRAETPYAAVAEAVAESDVIAVVHGPERAVLGPSPPSPPPPSSPPPPAPAPAADIAAAAAVVAVVIIGDIEDDKQPELPPPAAEEEDEGWTFSFPSPPLPLPVAAAAAAAAAVVVLAVAVLPRFPQFTVPTLAQRVMPPMSLATPTTLPLLRPYGDGEGDVEDASGAALPFDSARGGEPGGTGTVREGVEEEEAEADRQEKVLLVCWQSRGGCEVVFPW